MEKLKAVFKFDSKKMVKELDQYMEDNNFLFIDEQDALDCACAFVYANIYNCCEVSVK